MPKRMDRDLQELGRAGLVAGRASEGFFDVVFLEFVEIARQMQSLGREMRLGGAVCWLSGALKGRDRFAVGSECNGPLDGVFKLADISIPRTALKRLLRLVGDRYRFPGTPRKAVAEMQRKLGDVVPTLA